MSDTIAFETPENVKIQYQLAGLGTRFLGWMTDQLLLFITGFLLCMILLVSSQGFPEIFEDMFRNSFRKGEAAYYSWGLMMLVIGLGNFCYYCLFELFMRGQTPGKRSVGIRVVKADGFALDSVSILVRNLFRVLDNIPLLWIVPVFSQRQQRLGDMVAGTLLISEDHEKAEDSLRDYLRRRTDSGVQPTFRFAGRLGRLDNADWHAVEEILNRLLRDENQSCTKTLELLTDALSLKLDVTRPDDSSQRIFLEDLLTAEYKRREGLLG